MIRNLVLTALLLVSQPALAEMRTVTSGIACDSIESATAAFDWASNNPQIPYIDLNENPGCFYISLPTVFYVEPYDTHENDVATVLIGQATPPNGETRYLWIGIRMKLPPIGA